MPAEYKRDMPDWASQEREADHKWVQDHAAVFFRAANTAFENSSRGALVVDTTTRILGKGHPFGYVTQDELARLNDDDIDRIVGEYEPEYEFVIVLWKTGDRTSTYRVQPLKYFN